ncbi:MAG: cytochrome c [Burkholderiales bacterium]|nr:MAG: cytochrome c [Burkholderiales bacterium]
MGDKVSGSKLAKLGFASLALAVTVATGAVLVESPAQAATKKAAAAKPAASAVEARKLFNDWSCGSCHVLKDAGGTGHVGPKLDGAKLTKAYVLSRVSNGQGAMPGFGGMLSKPELDTLSAYIAAQSNK